MTVVHKCNSLLSTIIIVSTLFLLIFTVSYHCNAQSIAYLLQDSIITDAPFKYIGYEDIDADGNPDVMTLLKGQNGFFIYSTDGKGKFIHQSHYNTGFIPIAFTLVNINGDPYPDIALISNSGMFQFLINQGNHNFTLGQELQIGVMTSDIQAVDLDLDGFEDLIIAVVSENKLTILWGSESQTFEKISHIPTANRPEKIFVGNFNQDVWPDIAVSAEENVLHHNLGNGHFDLLNKDQTSQDNDLPINFDSHYYQSIPSDNKSAQIFLLGGENKIWLLVHEDSKNFSSQINSGSEIQRSLVEVSLYYQSGNAELDSVSIETLNQICHILSTHPTAKLLISSHTDSDASFRSNLSLSFLRTHKVLDFFHQKGVDPQRLIGRAYGEAKPLVPNTNASNKQLNRRTELSIIIDGALQTH